MRYIVGYTADERGRNAIALAASLARGQDASLVLVLVLPPSEPFEAVYPPETSYQSIVAQQARTWLHEAIALVPEGVSATAEIRYATSHAAGLLASAQEHAAAAVVIGAARRSLLRRISIGRVADELFRTSDVPVAIAPLGHRPSGPVERLSVMLGRKPGGEALIEVGTSSAAMRGIGLRIVSLLALEDDPIPDRERAQEHAEAVRDAARVRLASIRSAIPVTAEVAHGETIAEACDRLEWRPHECVLIGSSRIAGSRRLPLGSTATRLLATLPVPMIVVPRDYRLPRQLDPFAQANDPHEEQEGEHA